MLDLPIIALKNQVESMGRKLDELNKEIADLKLALSDRHEAGIDEITKELTSKDLYCIARHIREYVKKVMQGDADFPDACVNCPHIHDNPVIHCHWDAFNKLSDLTGVNIYAQKGA